ncbi:dTDP-4-dehydrorhamnose reductase [Priestia megaterium]|uniref:dTDP-4-dehydrorhamnose reductase n=1 Tax=Priestia megaterium TaxID=1404 RepID=UPI0030F3807B
MNILITGADGQLGKELVRIFHENGDSVQPYNKQQLDITDFNRIKVLLSKEKPDLIINAAAYTKVDLCEERLGEAYLINAIGPYYLAREAKEKDIKLFHISTDYVFSGNRLIPYKEEDITEPQTIYGKSKRLGEELVLNICKDATIVRTSWLYGYGGENFVNTIIKMSDNLEQIRVVDDQHGCPTYTKDLGIAIKHLIEKPPGIYHVTNSGNCSWYEFAIEIIKILKKPTKIIPISTKEYGMKTPRPFYSVLSNKKLSDNQIALRNWKEGLFEYLKRECAFKDGN